MAMNPDILNEKNNLLIIPRSEENLADGQYLAAMRNQHFYKYYYEGEALALIPSLKAGKALIFPQNNSHIGGYIESKGYQFNVLTEKELACIQNEDTAEGLKRVYVLHSKNAEELFRFANHAVGFNGLKHFLFIDVPGEGEAPEERKGYYYTYDETISYTDRRTRYLSTKHREEWKEKKEISCLADLLDEGVSLAVLCCCRKDRSSETNTGTAVKIKGLVHCLGIEYRLIGDFSTQGYGEPMPGEKSGIAVQIKPDEEEMVFELFKAMTKRFELGVFLFAGQKTNGHLAAYDETGSLIHENHASDRERLTSYFSNSDTGSIRYDGVSMSMKGGGSIMGMHMVSLIRKFVSENGAETYVFRSVSEK